MLILIEQTILNLLFNYYYYPESSFLNNYYWNLTTLCVMIYEIIKVTILL